MKNTLLVASLGVMCVGLLAWCGTSKKPTPQPQPQPIVQEAPAGTYEVASCNQYLEFVECVASFSIFEGEDREQITAVLNAIKSEWDTLSLEELQTRCDETREVIVSTPELAEHPQCWIPMN